MGQGAAGRDVPSPEDNGEERGRDGQGHFAGSVGRPAGQVIRSMGRTRANPKTRGGSAAAAGATKDNPSRRRKGQPCLGHDQWF